MSVSSVEEVREMLRVVELSDSLLSTQVAKASPRRALSVSRKHDISCALCIVKPKRMLSAHEGRNHDICAGALYNVSGVMLIE